MKFEIIDTNFEGLKIFQRLPFQDGRGEFERLYCAEDLSPFFGCKPIVQINRSKTINRGTVRGLHFQYPPHSEIKVISCIRGEVIDVALDIRRNSSTFLKFFSMRLSSKDFKSIFIPEGFAHGFQALTDNSELLYFHTSKFEPISEGGINAMDPKIGIDWPIKSISRSIKDSEFRYLPDDFEGIDLL